MGICPKCGYQSETAEFCRECGAEMESHPSADATEILPPDDRKPATVGYGAPAVRHSLSRFILITVAVVVFALAAAIAFIVNNGKPETPLTAAQILDLGEKFLLELDYEQAIIYFEQLIEIEPRNARGYTGLAEAYIELGMMDEAIFALEQGYDQTDDRRIKAMLEELTDAFIYAAYYDALKDAIDTYGVYDDTAEEGFWENGGKFSKGVAYADLIDFDDDGIPELLYCGDLDLSNSTPQYPRFYVYSYNKRSRAAERLGDETMEIETGAPAMGIGITIGADGRRYITLFSEPGGPDSSRSDMYSVVNAKWQKVIEFTQGEHQVTFEMIYEIDGQSASEQEYKDTFALYDSGYGYRVDGSSFNGWAVRDFLEELRLGGAPRWSEIVETVSIRKRELNEWFGTFFASFNYLGNFNIEHYDKNQIIMFALMHKDLSYAERWTPVPGGRFGEMKRIEKEYIEDVIARYFGITDIEHTPGIVNQPAYYIESFEYRDGYYYLEPVPTGGEPDLIQAVDWIDNGDGTYSALLEKYAISMGDPYPDNPYDSKELWHGWDYFNDRDVYLGNLQPYGTAAAVVKVAEYNGEQVYQLLELIDPGTIGELTLPAAKPPRAVADGHNI